MNFTLLDGAMGTMLHAAGLDPALPSDTWNTTHPERLTAIHARYAAAGSEVLLANTFCSNRLNLAKTGRSVAETVEGAVLAAREAAKGTGARVALDIGPLSRLISPLGDLDFDEAAGIFREMAEAGRRAGADLAVIETMSDITEAKAALLGVREACDLPVWVTMTFDAAGRTYLGASVEAMGIAMQALGADAVGFNCCLGPRELLPLVQRLAQWTSRPIILKPNAGLPDPETGEYHITPREFADAAAQAVQYGAVMLGGCCGTTPEFIAALRERLAGMTPQGGARRIKRGVCSASRHAELAPGLSLSRAVSASDPAAIEKAAEAADGADVLRVSLDETSTAAALSELRTACTVPMALETASAAVLERVLRPFGGCPLVIPAQGADAAQLRRVCERYGALLAEE